MKTLHLYILRQVLATLAMTVFVFTFILLLGNLMKEILNLLIHRQATIGLVLKAIGLLIPYGLAFALPIGMLTAALLVFGRFSADQELTAARASGVSLLSLISPVLFLSVILSGVCAWLNFDVAPRCRVAYKELLFNAGMARPSAVLQSNQYTTFRKTTVYIGQIEPDGVTLNKIIITKVDDQGDLQFWGEAPRGRIVSGSQSNLLVLELENEFSMVRKEGAEGGWLPGPTGTETNSVAQYPIEIAAPTRSASPPQLSDMTFWQLWFQLDQLERASAHSRPVPKVVRNPNAPSPRPRAMEANSRIYDLTMPVIVQIHREVAFSFACIGFTLVGIPLGIRAHRRETSVGIALALLLVVIYYSFIILGQAWETHPERAPHLILWLPNFIFQAVGAVLLWRANRGIQ